MKQLSGKNLILIGFMGTGKTEVGRLLAESLSRRLVDTDQLIAAREGMPVAEIFSTHGEPYFRRRERETVQELVEQKGLVIATGGGMVMDKANVEALRKSGLLIWLDADIGALEKRLAGDTTRPLLAGENADLAGLYKEREPLYRLAADVRVNTTDKPPLAIVEEIFQLLQGKNS